MGQKVTSDPFDYRFYVDDAVLVKIKELVNSNSMSPVYANLVNSVTVGKDQEVNKTIEEKKADVSKEETKASETSIDFKRALDVLRFKKDESNPYYPKGENATPEAIEEFNLQYDNARDIMTTHVGTDPKKVTELPSRVVVAQKDYLLQSIKQSRQDAVNSETAKLADIQTETNGLKSHFESAKAELNRLQGIDPNTMTIDQQQAHAQNIAQAQNNVTNIRALIYNNLSSSKEIRENIKNTENALSKTDKDFKKSLKSAERKINKEERTSFKQMVKNIKTSVSNKIEDYKTQKAFDQILGKEETQTSTAPQTEVVKNEPVKENAEEAQPVNGKPVVLSAEETAAKEAAKKAELENKANELSAKLQSGEITQEQHTEMSIDLAKEYGQQAETAPTIEEPTPVEETSTFEPVVEQNNSETLNNDLVNRFVNEMGLSQEAAEAAAIAAVNAEAMKVKVEAPQEAAPTVPAAPEGMTE